ncbi:hypothetical protein [uncultured Duncaniella sp.]|nr:hypothetical protein [uncultured Duncaniella sp.]
MSGLIPTASGFSGGRSKYGEKSRPTIFSMTTPTQRRLSSRIAKIV